MHQMNYIPLR